MKIADFLIMYMLHYVSTVRPVNKNCAGEDLKVVCRGGGSLFSVHS